MIVIRTTSKQVFNKIIKVLQKENIDFSESMNTKFGKRWIYSLITDLPNNINEKAMTKLKLLVTNHKIKIERI